MKTEEGAMSNQGTQWKKSKLICVLIYSVLFYVACYFMVPHGQKLLFVIVFCLGGFVIPWIPFLAEEKIKSIWVLSILKILFCAPIVLFIAFLVKYSVIANNNYILPESSEIKYTISADWELVENNYVGEDFKHFIYCDSKEERVEYHTIYSAVYGEMIDLSPRIREYDEYDEDEFAIENIEFKVTKEFEKKKTVSKNIELTADTELNYDGEEFINSGGYFMPEDHGRAIWRCTITINRKFDFWEILVADLG